MKLLSSIFILFTTTLFCQEDSFIKEVIPNSVISVVELRHNSNKRLEVFINNKKTSLKTFEKDFAEQYKKKISGLSYLQIMTSTVSIQVEEDVLMSKVDSIRHILSKNSLLKILYPSGEYFNKGIILRLYSYENYGKEEKKLIADVRENYFLELNKSTTNTEPDNSKNPPIPPPPPPSAPTTYQFLKPYFKKGNLVLPSQEGIHSIKFKNEELIINNTSYSSPKDIQSIFSKLLKEDNKKIFVLLFDNNTTYKNYYKFIFNLYNSVYKVRDELSIEYYNIKFSKATPKQQRYLKNYVPLKIIDYSFEQWGKLFIEFTKN